MFKIGKKAKSKNILCLFDYQATTGFATVSQNIIEHLENVFGDRLYLTIFAVNYFGKPIIRKNKNIYPASLVDPKNDPFGRNQFLKILKEGNIDGVFIINDLGVITPIIEVMRAIKAEKKISGYKSFKSIFYFPVDADHIEYEFKDLDFFDLLVPYTEYAKEKVLAAQPQLAGKTKVILHGVNHKDFHPISIEDKNEFRKAYFGEENASRYIIGNVNRNQPRKDIPSTIFAFDLYRKLHDPNALLYLHMDPDDPMGWKLRRIIHQLGMVENEHVMFPPQEQIDNYPEAGYVNMIYNCLDLFLTTTTGEGFGLTILEAMQCGVPIIAPYNTSIKELSGHDTAMGRERMFIIPPSHNIVTHYDNIVREAVSYPQVADLIHKVRHADVERGLRIENARHYASSLDWRNVCQEWAVEFKRIFY